MGKNYRQLFKFGLLLLTALFFVSGLFAQNPAASDTFRVGIAGTPPFITEQGGHPEGIAWEIWESLAARAGWPYTVQQYESVPQALDAMNDGKINLLVGPVSITAKRAKNFRFSQPYFQSSLGILSRTDPPTIWQRLKPFFSASFFIAVGVLLLVLAIVGTLIWLAEREVSEEEFPHDALGGITNGIWLALVTMTTVGYGDKAPKTFWGRLVTGVWMLISVITATSFVASIASTLTITGLNRTVISTAEQLNGHRVAVLSASPAEGFSKQYGAKIKGVATLDQAYNLLKDKKVDAVVYDRPQLLYYLKLHHDDKVAVSKASYMMQGYGFAFPLESNAMHELNVQLLELEESGRVDRIVNTWLGTNNE